MVRIQTNTTQTRDIRLKPVYFLIRAPKISQPKIKVNFY